MSAGEGEDVYAVFNQNKSRFCSRDKWSPELHVRPGLEEELQQRRQLLLLSVQQKEQELQELKQSHSSANEALRFSQDTFSQAIRLMKEKEKAMEQEVVYVLQSATTGLHISMALIKEDVEDLKEQMALCESLLQTDEPYEFLLKHNALLQIPEAAQRPGPPRHLLPLRSFTLDRTQVPHTVAALSVSHQNPPSMHLQLDYLGWEATCRCISWDPDSAHRNVLLRTTRGGHKWAVFKSQPLSYEEHPARFSHCVQVLSREPLTGRCYFEVTSCGDCFIGLTYKSIQRKGTGKQSVLGLNDKSWACFGGGHAPQRTEDFTWLLVANTRSNRVAVMLDHDRGLVRFYSESERGLSLLSEVQTRFTEPLYLAAAFLTPGDHVVIPKVRQGQDVVLIPPRYYS